MHAFIRMERINLGLYVKNFVEPLFEAAIAAETLKYKTVNKNEFRRKWMNEKKGNRKDKGI